MLKPSTFSRCRAGFVAVCALVLGINLTAFADEKPHRVKDLAYGGVLYEYHQGNAFEALSLLNVAKDKGGIQGHGDHPDLVEGGLLLSYGMTLEAKAIFENLLQNSLSLLDQNLAWFYLGKVFYLEQNFAESLDSFDKINTALFSELQQEKYYEMLYVKSQISAMLLNLDDANTKLIEQVKIPENALPTTHIYHYYIRYNQAVNLLDGQQNEAAIKAFTQLINALSLEREEGQWRNQVSEHSSSRVDLARELKALYNQSLLSLGQLYLQNKADELAFNSLKQVDKDSVFSDQALFAYAISASNLERHDLALTALSTLNKQRLFNPWQQQTPYALAYLYEQLSEPVLALEAYRAAVLQYESLQEDLSLERQNLTESVLLDVLKLKTTLGSEAVKKDAYGRLILPKQAFSFARLLSSEAFQRQLSELHELYLIKNSMQRWETKLSSFEDMLETRLLSRQQKLAQTRDQLAQQEVDEWTQKEQQFKHDIEQAIKDENAYFFMTDEQIAYFNRLEKAQERLNSLPQDHKKKAEYTQRYNRARAYFRWWIYDEFSVNRWRTEKELIALQLEMTKFRKQYQLLESEQELDDAHRQFTQRVSTGKMTLERLKASLNDSLSESSQTLLSQVDMAMQKQLAEIGQYLLASREALARVSDSLLVAGKIRYTDQDDTNLINTDNVKTDREDSAGMMNEAQTLEGQ